MRTTKNISINENAFGFTVNNNYATIGQYNTLDEAVAKAFEVAKGEEKGVVVNTEFVKVKRTSSQVTKMVRCTTWVAL